MASTASTTSTPVRLVVAGCMAVGLVAAVVTALGLRGGPLQLDEADVTRYVDRDHLTDVAAADDGTVWVGTLRAGVAHFDGDGWTEYTTADGLPDNTVTSVAIADDGVVWVTTRTGVSSFDGGEWTPYDSDDGLPDDRVTVVDAGGETVWVAVEGYAYLRPPSHPEEGRPEAAVSRFDGEAWQTFAGEDGPPHDLVESLAVDDAGALWVLTREDHAEQPSADRPQAGLSRFDGDTWTTFLSGDDLPDDYLGDVVADGDGTVWAIGETSMSRYDEGGWATATAGDEPLMPVIVATAAAGADGDVWAMSTARPDTDGVRLLRFNGRAWRQHAILDDPGGDVAGLAVDEDGSAWVAGAVGLLQLTDDGWVDHPRGSGAPGEFVEDLAVARDGTLWVSGHFDLARFDGDEWTDEAGDLGNVERYGGPVEVADDGTVWAVVDGMLARFDGTGWQTNEYYLLGRATDLALSPAGDVWVTAGDRVLRFDGGGWTTYAQSDGLPDASLTEVAVGHDGTVWAGAGRPQTVLNPLQEEGPVDGGLARFDSDGWNTFSSSDGLASDAVQAVAVGPDGTVWAGTDEGLSSFDGRRWETYTSSGLFDDAVEAVTVADDGSVWIGTVGGVAGYDGHEWASYPLRTEDFAGRSQPVRVREVAVAGDGTLWAATPEGLLRFTD